MDRFTKLMIQTAKGNPVIGEYSVSESDAAIRNHFFEVLELNEDASVKEIKRAVRKHKAEVFEIIEDTIEEMLISGWGDNPFFRQFVEVRNLADGDTNEFYVADNSILTVSEFSGNHHDLHRQKLGMGRSYSVKTSWYGINF